MSPSAVCGTWVCELRQWMCVNSRNVQGGSLDINIDNVNKLRGDRQDGWSLMDLFVPYVTMKVGLFAEEETLAR